MIASAVCASSSAPGPSVCTMSCDPPGCSSSRYAAMPAMALSPISSMIDGCRPEDTITAAARAAASSSEKVALIVGTMPDCTGRSFTVASTITASVPSDPIMSDVRSSPVTPLTVRCPSESRRPSASTTLRPSTASRVTPYFAQSSPPAFVAMLPPTVEIARLAGSGANQRPCGSSWALSSALMMPGSITASSSSRDTSSTRFMARVESTISPPLRDRSAGKPGARAPCDDRRAGGVGDAHRGLHVGHRLRRDHGQGPRDRDVAGLVGPCGVEVGHGLRHALAEFGAQQPDDVVRVRQRWRTLRR